MAPTNGTSALIIPKWFLYVIAIVGPSIGGWMAVELRRGQSISEANTAQLVQLNEKHATLNLEVEKLNVKFEAFGHFDSRVDSLESEVHRAALDRADIRKEVELLQQKVGMN